MLRENHQAETAAYLLKTGSRRPSNRLAAGLVVSDAE
jgi:hypothetical protein